MPEETRNLIIALVLSLSIVFAWQHFYVKPYQEALIAHEQQELAKAEATGAIISAPSTTDDIGESRLEQGEATFPDRDEALDVATARRITINTAELSGSFSLQGLRLDDLLLKNYNIKLNDPSNKVPMLSPHGTEHMYFAEFGWTSGDKTLELPGKDTIWSSDATELTETSPVTLTWVNAQNVTFTRVIAVDDHFMFSITDSIDNQSEQPLTLASYAFIERARENTLSYYISHEGMLGVFDNKLTEIGYDDLADEPKGQWKASSNHGWTGMTDKFWLTSIIPPQDQDYSFNYHYRNINGLNRYHADYLSATTTITAGSHYQTTHHFFAGAKKVNLLDSYNDKLGLRLFDRAVDFGMLYFITKPFYHMIMFFQGISGNFGIAILLITLVIKIAMFPLANKSYRSMARLKQYAPELQAIKERHGDDKSKMQQEMMKFYHDNRINPLSGCWPMLVQIPIFFALYKVLFVTIEMRHAPFYGWIEDLSVRDPLNALTLFGLLDWELSYSIGLLPILFSVTMIIQQKLNPPPSDPTQAFVIKWMPYVFLVIFANFPAGLVLYWTFSNVLSIMQQYVITRKIAKEEDAPATGSNASRESRKKG